MRSPARRASGALRAPGHGVVGRTEMDQGRRFQRVSPATASRVVTSLCQPRSAETLVTGNTLHRKLTTSGFSGRVSPRRGNGAEVEPAAEHCATRHNPAVFWHSLN